MPDHFDAPELTTVGDHRALVWRLPAPMLSVSSAPLGGGVGLRSWVLNVQVPTSYGRLDPADHLTEVAETVDLQGAGTGFLTAASVEQWTTATEPTAPGWPVRMDATVGISHPIWAAATDEDVPAVGTINLVARAGRRLSDAAIINAVATMAEAKSQAMLAAGVEGTGTATDALCVLCPLDGEAEAFGGPRSTVGAPLARVTFAAVAEGITRYRARSRANGSMTRPTNRTSSESR